MAKLIHLTAACALAAGVSLVHAADDKPILGNGKTVVKQSDVRYAAQAYLPPQQQERLWTDEKGLRQFISQLFVFRKLAEEGKDLKLTDIERWRLQDARDRALAEIVIARAVAAPPIPNYDKLAKETYEANPSRYQDPERVHAEHILIATKSRSDAEAQKRAEEVLAKVKAGGADFAALAKEYSDDPSAAKNSGDLGWFAKGRMVKSFEDAAFALDKPGQIAGPVKSDFGYHVIRLIEHKAAEPIPFERVKDQLVNDAKAKVKRERMSAEYQRINTLPTTAGDEEALLALLRKPAGSTQQAPAEAAKPAAKK